MKIVKFTFVFLIFSLLFPSCIYHCAGYPKELWGWTPYKAGDVLRFQSDSDQIVFEIDSINVTKPYIFDGPIEERCRSKYYFDSDNHQLPQLSGYSRFSVWVAIDYEFTFKKLITNYVGFSFDINKPLNDGGVSKFDTINYQLNKSIVKDVISIERLPPYLNPDVNKIFVHYGKGLVGFIKNGREYKLVE